MKDIFLRRIIRPVSDFMPFRYLKYVRFARLTGYVSRYFYDIPILAKHHIHHIGYMRHLNECSIFQFQFEVLLTLRTSSPSLEHRQYLSLSASWQKFEDILPLKELSQKLYRMRPISTQILFLLHQQHCARRSRILLLFALCNVRPCMIFYKTTAFAFVLFPPVSSARFFFRHGSSTH